jgi:type IV secretory pathway VirB4 component
MAFGNKKKNSTDKTVPEASAKAPASGKAKTAPAKSGKPPKKKALPRTVQDTLDWVACYENGVFQIAPKTFSQTFRFDDISFRTKSQEDQDAFYEAYMRFLNLMQAGEDLFFTFHNYREDEEEKLSRVLPAHRGDSLDELREEMSQVLRDNAKLSRNCISTARYATIIIHADTVDDAMHRMATVAGTLENNFKQLTTEPLHPLTLAERLEVLSTILNGSEPNYWFVHDKDGNTSIDFSRMAKQGLTTKDIIAPTAIRFKQTMFEIDERVGQAMYLDGIANWMDTKFIPDLIDVTFESVYTMHISVMDQEEAVKKVRLQHTSITSSLIAAQDKAVANGRDPQFTAIEVRKKQEQIESLQEDILNRDQRLFCMSLNVVHFADDEKTLKEQNKTIKSIAGKYMCNVNTTVAQQERGLFSALPLGHDRVICASRKLTTESLGVFMPFDEANCFDDNGVYYGRNPVNKSLIVYDRTKSMNYNGLYLGESGSGKSFSAKREMSSVLLTRDDDVMIIDPDGEYIPLADAFDGEVIHIAPGNGVYINPFDLDIDTSFDSDMNPVTMKIDFICGLLETMLGNGAMLSPIQKSIIDRCVTQMYRPYLEHLNELPAGPDGRKPTIDRAFCPTMQNLFDSLLNQPQAEAQNLALVMETYTTGAFDTFAHRTNVDVQNRLIIYDIKNIGSNLKELALKVCTNDVWTRMIANRSQGKWTRFYADEFHLLLGNMSTAEFMKSFWKRARKFQGVPTGITQNVEDLLNSPAARAIINNTSFIYMLRQSSMDRGMLQELLHLSSGDLSFITNVERGHGIIYMNGHTVPFEDKFPQDTKLYKIMSTSASEN